MKGRDQGVTTRAVSGMCAALIVGFGIAANLHGIAAWIVYPAAGTVAGVLMHKALRG